NRSPCVLTALLGQDVVKWLMPGKHPAALTAAVYAPVKGIQGKKPARVDDFGTALPQVGFGFVDQAEYQLAVVEIGLDQQHRDCAHFATELERSGRINRKIRAEASVHKANDLPVFFGDDQPGRLEGDISEGVRVKFVGAKGTCRPRP